MIDNNAYKLFVLGLLLILIVVFVIKQVEDIISERGKIIYIKYTISYALAFVSGFCLLLIYKENSKYLMIIVSMLTLIFLLYPFISCINLYGLIKGICICLIQIIATIMIFAVLYLSLALGIIFCLFIFASTMRYDNKFIRIISISRDEIIYILQYNDYTFYDNDGNTYLLSNKYFIRQEDMKYFELY